MNILQNHNPVRFSSGGGYLYHQLSLGNDETGMGRAIFRFLDRHLPATMRDENLIPPLDSFQRRGTDKSFNDADLSDIFQPNSTP